MDDDYRTLALAALAKSSWDFPRADVVSIHDGDTLDLDIVSTVDIGFNDTITTTRRRNFRLFGCNANELTDPGGIEARDNLRAMLPIGTQLRLASVKDDKYGGRFDAILWAGTPGNEYNVVQKLIDTHWAVAWNGNGTKPKPPWPRPEDTK